MISKATSKEMSFIYSKIAESASEGAAIFNSISIDKAYQIVLPVLNNGGYYVVYRNPENYILGWILIGENFDLLEEQWHGFIYELYVLPEYRKRGIGKLLLQHSIKNLKQQGYREVRLNVYSANTAKQIYEGLGFKYLQSVMQIKTKDID
ncbi:GNAT family N-acetyltransferase [Aquibacillus halophilus]|uniref:GNAT family N-acetyltransferase n=1 Tax=Aquibacillus halophilus TaxID=930132 RepID=A0A6A8DCI4_9BACI|nr:GNAT family N-acetyltransferase [Aquibacillus halophilus]MRH43405.1 GNAT family N-acetyltransferase [Aquibacillus halophilus]